ncbi:TonB-dependent receptor plug domain-containing protein, partial [Phenylobacterium sp.]|uniref:TonB-dependent receptor plug domain-containing protein n=1 Tax=Phenylobacterium sp. TaxID=1871053 RepID=UPI00286A1234
MKINTMRERLLASSMICGVALAAFSATTAYAQDEEVQEVVVTGSRIVRQDYVATSPIATVTGEQAVANADVTLDTYLNTLPQVNPAGSTTSNNPGNAGQSNVDLRGLGNNRNLVLVDGRRPMVSANTLTVDLNTIPQAMVETIEVITGGAGATYGADAVAGVVNLKIKSNFEGLDLRASYSDSTDYQDSKEFNISAVLGGNFADGKGNAIFGFDRSFRESILKGQRPFSALATSTTGTPPAGVVRYNGGNAIPLSAVQALFATYGVAPSAVSNGSGSLGFNLDGTLFYGGVGNNPTLNVQNFKYPVDVNVNTRFFPDFYSYTFDAPNLLTLPLDRYSFMT